MSDTDFDHLRLSLFYVPLPEPVPIPHGTTISFDLEEQDSRLRGVPWQPVNDMPPIPGWDGDHLFVSVKFWQVKAVSDYHIRQVEAVSKVISAVKGGEVPGLSAHESATITVAELITPTPHPASDSASDPFLRCLDCLIDVVDAYRIAEKVQMARLSYEQLGPMILSYQRSLAEPYEWWGPTAMQLDHVNVKIADPDHLDSTRLKRVIQFAVQLRSNHPFSR